jgi:hypothetical protein
MRVVYVLSTRWANQGTNDVHQLGKEQPQDAIVLVLDILRIDRP